MKLILTFVAFAAITSDILAASGVTPKKLQNGSPSYLTILKSLMAHKDTLKFFDRFLSDLRTPNIPTKATESLLPPISDPTFGPERIEINIPISMLDPNLTIVGTVETITPEKITGLNGLVDKFQIVLGVETITVSWGVTIPSVSFMTDNYKISIQVLKGAMKSLRHSVLGSGPLDVSASSVFLSVAVTLKVPIIVTKPIGLSKFALDFGFENLTINGGNATIDRNPVNWDEFSLQIQDSFDTNWSNESKALSNEVIRCSIDHVINSCTVIQLLTGKTGCLKFEINENCFEPLVPRTEPLIPKTERPATGSGFTRSVSNPFLIVFVGIIALSN